MQLVLDKVLIIGLGLIGGSLARSLKETGHSREVVGYGYRDVSLKKGVEQGIIDSYSIGLQPCIEQWNILEVNTFKDFFNIGINY